MVARKSVAADVLTSNPNEFYTGGNARRGGSNVDMRNLIADQFLNRNSMCNQNTMPMMPYAMAAPQHNNNLYGDFNACTKPPKKKNRRRRKYYYSSSSDDNTLEEEEVYCRKKKKKNKNNQIIVVDKGNDKDIK